MYYFLQRRPKMAGKAAQFGASYWRLIIVEMQTGFGPPARVAENTKGLVRIVRDETWSVGDTPRSGGFRVRQEMIAECEELNRNQES